MDQNHVQGYMPLMGYVDGMSVYEYVADNPGAHTDANGLWKIENFD